MDNGGVHGRNLRLVRDLIHKVPATVQETLAALHGLVGPGGCLLKVADEHDIQAHGVGAISLDDIIRINHIAQGLAHLHSRALRLGAVLLTQSLFLRLGGDIAYIVGILAQDHAVAGALGIRLLGVDHADIIEELVPKTGIEQVQRGVLHAAVVPIHRAPILLSLFADQLAIIMGIHVAQEVPGGTGPLGHGVCLSLGGAAAAGTGGVDPVGHLAQGAFAVISGLIALHLRQHQRQLALGNRHPAALLAVHQRDRLAPVALAGEDPVTELVVHFFLAPALFHGILLHGGDGFLHGHAVEETGVDHDGLVILGNKGLLGDIAALDHLNDGKAELFSEIPVALVVAGHAHDDAGAVAHEDIIGYKHGQAAPGNGIDDLHALQADAGLVLVQLATLKVGLAGSGGLIVLHIGPVGDLVLPLLQKGMLRGDDHVGSSVQSVGTGGVNGDIVAHVGLEGDLRTGGAADPVLLLDLHTLDEVQIVQVVDEAVGILGDAEHPLALFLTDHLAAAALAHTLHHFLIGQDALAAGAPVHGHGGLVCQVVLKELEEYPLGPLVVVGIGGVHAAVPVEAITQHLELPGEILDVLLGDNGGMYMVLDGEVLRGEAEGIEANGEEHIVPLHALFPGDHINSGKGPWMTHMEACRRGIRELDEAVELFSGLVAGDGGVGLGLFPVVLPFLFNGRKIVLHTVSPFYLKVIYA